MHILSNGNEKEKIWVIKNSFRDSVFWIKGLSDYQIRNGLKKSGRSSSYFLDDNEKKMLSEIENFSKEELKMDYFSPDRIYSIQKENFIFPENIVAYYCPSCKSHFQEPKIQLCLNLTDNYKSIFNENFFCSGCESFLDEIVFWPNNPEIDSRILSYDASGVSLKHMQVLAQAGIEEAMRNFSLKKIDAFENNAEKFIDLAQRVGYKATMQEALSKIEKSKIIKEIDKIEVEDNDDSNHSYYKTNDYIRATPFIFSKLNEIAQAKGDDEITEKLKESFLKHRKKIIAKMNLYIGSKKEYLLERETDYKQREKGLKELIDEANYFRKNLDQISIPKSRKSQKLISRFYDLPDLENRVDYSINLSKRQAGLLGFMILEKGKFIPYECSEKYGLSNALPFSLSGMKKEIRQLQGIVEVYEGEKYHREPNFLNYELYYCLTNSSASKLFFTETGGEFRSSFFEKDLKVLGEIAGITQELRRKHGERFNPSIHPQTVSKELGLSKKSAKESFQRLEGILCKKYVHKYSKRLVKTYYLPKSRVDDAINLIDEFS